MKKYRRLHDMSLVGKCRGTSCAFDTTKGDMKCVQTSQRLLNAVESYGFVWSALSGIHWALAL
eukprot:3990907-Amphidinium_carterae.1